MQPMQSEVVRAHEAKLADVLTPDQLTLMLNLLHCICVSGYGELSIVIKDEKIRFLRVTFSIPAPPKADHE